MTVITTIIDTVFALKAHNTPGDHLLMESTVPDVPSLLHAVEASLELPDHVLGTRFQEPFRLCHIANVVGIEQAIKKSGLDIKLLNFPVEGSTNVS